jgi:hypothetical protein
MSPPASRWCCSATRPRIFCGTARLRCRFPDARHRPAPYLRPLLETLDEREHYGVVLLDRQQARFFSVFMGEIEERHEVFAALDVRATRTTGTDHIFSEKKFQRRADTHAHLHLKRVTDTLRALSHVSPFDRLVVAARSRRPPS